MSYQTKNKAEFVQINVEKYSKIIPEIKKFINAKKEKSPEIRGIVEKIDLSTNVLTVRLQSINHRISRGSLVSVIDSSDRRKDSQGNIIDIYNSTVKIEIKTDPQNLENKEVIIDSNKINIILKRLESVIDNLDKGKINEEKVRILDFIIGENAPQYSKERVSFISKKLNENQKEAVRKSIEANDFHLVIGPPGTGKTFVIEELIKQFSKRNKKLLITAWTNLAVDNIIKRLDGKETERIVRIGPINEIEPTIRKYSIFEKMKKHEDWKIIEEHSKRIDNLFKALPTIKNKINQSRDKIDQVKKEIEVFRREISNHKKEKQKYESLISISIINENTIDISSVNNEMTLLDQKSRDYLSLSNNILEMCDIEFDIQQLKNKKIKSSLLNRMITKFSLRRQYNKQKRLCVKEFNRIYEDKNGQPDKDALSTEFEIYKILENKYFPTIKEQETINTKRKISVINKEVYGLYLESLKRKIDLLEIMIKGREVELYIKINYKETLEEYRKNILNTIEFYKKQTEKLKKDITSEIINGADLIAATAVSSCHYFLDKIKFDIVIMDEASQVASFMSLLPLLKCKKFILVGDNKQLQPIEEKNISKELNLSIFNRLFELYSSAATLLAVQYRMHKTIAQIASEIFYEGKLRTSEKVAKKILNLKAGKHQFLNPKIPVIFIDTSRAEYYEDNVGSGCANTKEAEYAAFIVSLFIKNGIKPKDIGIITPYIKQKLLLKKFIADIKIKDIEIDTIHKFQGREKEIIIISFARSKKYAFSQDKLRFIENETLVNVGITRAKKKLVLVGNSKTLRQSRLLDKVIGKIGKENLIGLR